jgi:hypothetical protein
MEPKLDSISIHDKSARTCEERMFYFRPVFGFGGREPKILRMPQVFEDFRIRYQGRDALGRYVCINDRVDQCWPKIVPPLVTGLSLSETRNKLFL